MKRINNVKFGAVASALAAIAHKPLVLDLEFAMLHLRKDMLKSPKGKALKKDDLPEFALHLATSLSSLNPPMLLAEFPTEQGFAQIEGIPYVVTFAPVEGDCIVQGKPFAGAAYHLKAVADYSKQQLLEIKADLKSGAIQSKVIDVPTFCESIQEMQGGVELTQEQMTEVFLEVVGKQKLHAVREGDAITVLVPQKQPKQAKQPQVATAPTLAPASSQPIAKWPFPNSDDAGVTLNKHKGNDKPARRDRKAEAAKEAAKAGVAGVNTDPKQVALNAAKQKYAALPNAETAWGLMVAFQNASSVKWVSARDLYAEATGLEWKRLSNAARNFIKDSFQNHKF